MHCPVLNWGYPQTVSFPLSPGRLASSNRRLRQGCAAVRRERAGVRARNAVNDYRRCGRVRVAHRAPASSSRLSEHPANVCAPPAGARRATLASQPDSLSREDNGIFPGTAGKKRLTALGEGGLVFTAVRHSLQSAGHAFLHTPPHPALSHRNLRGSASDTRGEHEAFRGRGIES